MQANLFQTSLFDYDGRGPSLVHWIYDADLLLPGSQSSQSSEPPGDIYGAHYGYEQELYWIVFHGLQVLQIVPEEVHSYWHLDYWEDFGGPQTGIWEIEDSEWLASFHPRHLKDHKHYIITFYDELVEVICQELIFGEGRFDIREIVTKDARFNYAYLRYANAQRGLGNLEQAAEYYQKYIDSDPNSKTAEYAQRCLNHIRTGSAET
jgi:tetratricopeptide (TPR) repeat protein